MDALLPMVAYRQWVLVLPKRLRYFVHRNPTLAGEVSRILGHALTRFYRGRSMAVELIRVDKTAAPSQIVVVQRFGERVNLHAHFHVVASDGVFALREEDSQGRGLVFVPTPEPDAEEIARLREALRRKILCRMLQLKVVPEESVSEMLRREHGGFSLDASVKVEARDRGGLERLLRYVLRPAVSLKRLSYLPECGLVRYRLGKGSGEVLEWEAVDFLGRFARLPRRRGNTWCATAGRWVQGRGCGLA
ncbi:MAG: transposase [Elusimicrobia bacterium]|nr:transposase [Elusimicrobiota bacterium]